jgi:hypothetical protein
MVAEAIHDTTQGMPAGLRDGYEVHRAALRHGFNVTLYPRQVLIAARPDQHGELSFVHGVPQSSTLAAVTYAQDKRMRRELLARAGVPVPPGDTFAIGMEVERARDFARAVGYPVVVKPAVGDNMCEVLPADNERQLHEAIQYLRVPEAERPTFSRSAYALTLLLEPDEEDGRTVAPAKYQFLVEQRPAGQYLRFLVLGNVVISALRCLDGQPGAAAHYADVANDVHPSLLSLAVQAAHAVPGLAVTAVDVTVADYTQPAASQKVCVVEFAERPNLSAQASVSEELSHQLGERIFAHEAAASGVTLPTARDEITVDFQIEGAAGTAGVTETITTEASRLGLTAQFNETDHVGGSAGGTLEGESGSIATLFELLTGERLHGQRAMLVDQRHR